MDANNPLDVAKNMLSIRGLDQTIERLDRYISGSIRSEQGKEFWQSVAAHVLAVNADENAVRYVGPTAHGLTHNKWYQTADSLGMASFIVKNDDGDMQAYSSGGFTTI